MLKCTSAAPKRVLRHEDPSATSHEARSERKVVRTDVVGDIELDCDVFSVAGTDLRIVAYTAASGSDAAAKLDFLRVSAVAAITRTSGPRP